MIDLSSETVVTFNEATSHLPRRRAGKKPNVATIYRWEKNGVRGIRLESIMVGGTRCTSLEALQRFCDALTAKAEGRPAPQGLRFSKSRRKQIDAAESRLTKAGI